ncbi:cell death abnormality protein 1-like, partial [Mizuhopecten yessoensis]|uniref:cell death abnormality protein 1-like n=1 Tax=Mizuhopecten yessoensis TaxID=6573 RepID=UPI000B4586AC
MGLSPFSLRSSFMIKVLLPKRENTLKNLVYQIGKQNDEDYEQRQRFGGFQIYQSNTSDWQNGSLCYKDTSSTADELSLIPDIPCTGSAQFLTIYSDRRSGNLSWYSENAFLELCEVEVYGCPLEKYGDGNCDSECGVGCANGLCDPVTGKCASCTPEFYGSHCNHTCPFNCKDNRCMQSNGECEDCEDGFFGSSCDVCSVGCTNRSCDKISGNCS